MGRGWSIAGFLVIAGALHVAAAALLMPEGRTTGTLGVGGDVRLSAGSAQIDALIDQWTSPPPTPDPPAPPAPAPAPEPDRAPTPRGHAPQAKRVASAPPRLAAPPNLPDLAPAAGIPADAPLMLRSADRPTPRPARPAPARQAEEPRRATTPAAAPARTSRPTAQPGTSRGGASGPASPSPGSRKAATLMARWGDRIRSCISRHAVAPRGARQGGRVILALRVGRDGRLQGVGIAASSGNAALDQAALDAARLASRCPAAPAGLTEPDYSFHLPISLR